MQAKLVAPGKHALPLSLPRAPDRKLGQMLVWGALWWSLWAVVKAAMGLRVDRVVGLQNRPSLQLDNWE